MEAIFADVHALEATALIPANLPVPRLTRLVAGGAHALSQLLSLRTVFEPVGGPVECFMRRRLPVLRCASHVTLQSEEVEEEDEVSAVSRRSACRRPPGVLDKGGAHWGAVAARR